MWAMTYTLHTVWFPTTLPISSSGDATVATWVDSGTSPVAPSRCGDLLTHYTNADTVGRVLNFHTMTYRLILEAEDLYPEVKISDEEHDDAQWLSLELDFARPKG
jgi:hypothetical protein